ncbi:LOW QUALITY PROTEIN: uncharacterized protein LOC135221688 [Macrobrachium nipponense]|uniref:LOW QUALITY PROTEIN: uncharacterized protein LOC135221688 n=1 Tax=Macrobrachium nipponense TaxID=159736 RepID=UPI0030C83ADB
METVVPPRERPASWGLYPLLDGADPESLVESGAVKAQDLPALVQVLEGRSPNVDLANLDPETQKLLEGLDLSVSFSGISNVSSGGSFLRVDRRSGKSRAYSILKGSHGDITEVSGVSTSGIWPLDSKENKEIGKSVKVDHLAQDSSKQGTKKIPPELATSTKIPLPQSTARVPSKACRSLLVEKPTSLLETDVPTSCQALENSGQARKIVPGKSSSEASDDGSVLVVNVGTLTLSPALLPPKVEDSSKVSGVRVMHRSRVCYLTTLDVIFPHLELPQDWDISQTCASRQLTGNEVHYSAKEILKLPPASAIEILRGQLIIRCFCRRLGERNSEEVGSAGVSLTDIWQLNGSEVRVPLFRSEPIKDDDDSLTRKHGKKGKKKEESSVNQPLAHLCFTAKLALAVNQPTMPTGSHKFIHKVVPPKVDSERDSTVSSVMHSSLDLSRRKKSNEAFSYASMHDSFSSVELDGVLTRDKEESFYLCPVPRPVSAGDSAVHPRFNSIYIPTHVSPRSPRPNEWQHSVDYRQVKFVGDIRSIPLETKGSDSGVYPCYGSFLTGINGQENPNNKPVESGGESPCIQTVPDFHSDLISNGAISRSAAMELSEGDFCRVHLEVIKGRNLPWVEGQDRIARPPNCYVRTNLGSLTVQTNVCNEMDNPVWNFAADVLLPYSQVAQTEGNLILKVHHTPWEHHSSPDDPLLGFVCVDATSIWSGHVSLCGWYPLLDLLGCVRGHIKVSLTPHEPPQPYLPPPVQRYPLNLQERPFRQPSLGPQTWKQTYPQHASLDRDILTSPRHRLGHSQTPSTCRVPFHPRYANTIPQSSPRICRKNIHERASKPDFTMNGVGTQSHDSSLFSKYSSVISTESVVVDVPVINEISTRKRKSPTQDMTPQKLESSSKVEKNTGNRSSSSIPVFSPGKDMTRRVIRSTADSRNLNSVLPEILYQDHFASSDSQVFKSKGLSTGREPPKNSSLSHDHSERDTSATAFTFNTKHPADYENTKGSIVAKDSQKKDQSTDKVHEERLSHDATRLPTKISTSEDKDVTREHQSKIPPAPASGPSAVNVKPNSCLKVPGSPSLRAKHVTFANKLIQQKGADIKSGTHSIQDRINRSPSSLPRLTQSSTHLPSHNVMNSHGQGTEDNATSSHGDRAPSENRYADGSDLQVVPCREGDTQVVTTTVSVPGSKTKYSVSGDNRGSTNSQLSCDKNRSDLIMSFSWMNQTSECDTPCVSYIESKHAVHGAVAASENGDLNIVHRKKDKSFGEKSRKLRSRLAANFPLK